MAKDAISQRQILESKTLFPILRHQQLLWVVGRMCLALLREWEGEFRRHADETDGMDTGECSTVDFSRYVFSLLLQECMKEQRHAGNTEMGVVIQVGSGYGICFLLIHLPLPLV